MEDLNLPEQLENEVTDETLILLPIIAHDDLLGAFMVANDPVQPAVSWDNQIISEERLKIIIGIIQQTAVAVENIQLLEARQEEAYISTVLLKAAQVVVSSADLVDTLDSIVHLMPILVGIESSAIYMWDADQKVFILTESTEKTSDDEESLIARPTHRATSRCSTPFLKTTTRSSSPSLKIFCPLKTGIWPYRMTSKPIPHQL